MILALDIATKTGYAYRVNSQLVAGTWKLASPPPKKGRNCCAADPRLLELEECLDELPRPDLIVYEDVPFIQYRDQAFLWSALKTVVVLWAKRNAVPVDCLAATSLKKFATGRGNAKKEDMAAALLNRGMSAAEISGYDDNAVDAIHLLRWAEQRMLR